MGNAAAGVGVNIGEVPLGSWLGISSAAGEDEKLAVLLRLHSVRNYSSSDPSSSSSEVVSGTVSVDHHKDLISISPGRDAEFRVLFSSVVSIDFRVSRTRGEVMQGYRLGKVSLPIEHIVRQYGGSLIHTWLPIEREPAAAPTASLAELFDKAVRSAPRDARRPMVCLSFEPGDSSTAIGDRASPKELSSSERSARFISLWHSHSQQERLLQALYRESRSRAVGGQVHVRDVLADSFAPQQASQERTPWLLEQECARLRQEVDTTAEEANARIQQASVSVTTLRERLTEREGDYLRLQQETGLIDRKAADLEVENNLLEQQLRARRDDKPGEEARRLKRDIQILGEQKEALLLILDDLYGATGQGRPPPLPEFDAEGRQVMGLNESQAEQQTAAPIEESRPPPIEPELPLLPKVGHTSDERTDGSVVPQPISPVPQGWTNMLPRPSELFASGFLSDDDEDY